MAEKECEASGPANHQKLRKTATLSGVERATAPHLVQSDSLWLHRDTSTKKIRARVGATNSCAE